MTARPRYTLREELVIRKIVTFYYREMSKHFYTIGERHDFWELLYVDKGEYEVITDSEPYFLSQGDMTFYKPNMFHGGRAINGTSPNLIILSFECSSACMDYFADKCMRLQEDDRQLLALIVQEGLQAFDPPINSADFHGCPTGSEGAAFGSEQLIRNYLEILLIKLIRKDTMNMINEKLATSTITEEKRSLELITAVTEYLASNLKCNFTFDQLCEKFAISRTRLKLHFKIKTGISVMEYFNRLKIEEAKRIIRDESASLSEISERLGYSSIYYFSKQFKRIAVMSPSEYARSIRALTQRTRGI
ncbi:AraC family transcriptional regulator [Paenibacillus eucommiae]|uniref:AraC-like DNA-binding protein n=1 Tax=Paenibacillus eucommiae TaxID=1355755 RepID=A0ABS4JAM2_9BACL|nr:AraC family transcriptional regulator [Paenibacillus eucommiae]MBP1996890.1 AraC-like DNA-binding protein [Paenibacillus eucommiae]